MRLENEGTSITRKLSTNIPLRNVPITTEFMQEFKSSLDKYYYYSLLKDMNQEECIIILTGEDGAERVFYNDCGTITA